jgi:hypothetical protein
LHSGIVDSRMSLDLSFPSSVLHGYHTVNPSSSQQAWIWAVGPEVKTTSSTGTHGEEKRDGGDGDIEQHSHYGQFVHENDTQLDQLTTT